MSKWKDSHAWSDWVCAHDGCGSECSDPDTVNETSCGKGHVNYLEPADPKSRHRRAFRTRQERSKTLRSEKAMRQMMHEAIVAGRKTIERREKRKARL